jgi:CyaY protein
MNESEFLALAQASLNAIENGLDQACAQSDLDVECSRSGNVLEIECITASGGSKIIVNSQAAMQELWIAAKAGGFHFRHDGQHWHNTRDGAELFAMLSELVSQQAQVKVILSPA